jgi:hypothetical protein
VVRKGNMVTESGWIKLHRQLIHNDIWNYDQTAWHVFEYFLLVADRKTGTRRFGRNQVAKALDMNPNTLYSALKRLEKAEMVNISSNSRFSVLSLVNWKEYQSSSTGLATSEQQLGNTKQEVRSKEDSVVYPHNTNVIAGIIGVEPTKGLDKYLNVTYKKYAFESFTDHYVQWCLDKKSQPTIGQWMNWVRRDEIKGLLKLKEVE